MYAGIDVGAQRLHCVGIDASRRVVSVAVIAADELEALVDWARAARIVCIDAPAELSRSPHRDDDPASPGFPKFQTARCAETALARDYGCWVPWVTPVAGAAIPPWMTVGLSVYEALSGVGIRTEEIYPHGGFRELAGRVTLPKKSSAAGSRRRVELLRDAGIHEEHLEMWSHDSLDACLGALVALQCESGEAQRVGCTHAGNDGSGIWLPTPNEAVSAL